MMIVAITHTTSRHTTSIATATSGTINALIVVSTVTVVAVGVTVTVCDSAVDVDSVVVVGGTVAVDSDRKLNYRCNNMSALCIRVL